MTGNNKKSRTKPQGMILQSRDLAFLRILGLVLEVVDRELFKIVAGFTSTTRANTRLLKLYRAGLLRRFFLGSGGGRKALYALSATGAQLAGVPYRGPRRRQDAHLVADFYIEHQLRVNEVYAAVHSRPRPEAVCTNWLAFHAAVAPSLGLIPDGYCELETPKGTICAFLEVDLGHERLSVWQEKARQYLQLALSGEFERRFGKSRFRVLVLANSERRRETIRETVRAVTEKIFWFATLESTTADFFAPVWLRPTGDTPQPLIETNL